eukprot:TRINITY_DN30985_c0_g1_i1.p1 TRINITY_DN30985_c0_g1~~TRINITY_DN30985_c0_g1_i1.p1  ORF type:complete len:216 (+),score=61.53 TRINITY_DN30985_c0_g1_i1:104-751(+)
MASPALLGQLLAGGATQRTEGVLGKIEAALKEKDLGNQHFAKEDNPKALYFYHRALLNINGMTGLTPEESKKVQEIKVSIQNNMAATYLRTGCTAKAIAQCTKVLESDSGNVKAIFRRGKAYAQEGNLERAEEDFARAERLDPNDKLVKKELGTVRQRLKQSEQKSKKFFANMFDKMSKEESPESSNSNGKLTAASDPPSPADFIDKDDYEPSAI